MSNAKFRIVENEKGFYVQSRGYYTHPGHKYFLGIPYKRVTVKTECWYYAKQRDTLPSQTRDLLVFDSLESAKDYIRRLEYIEANYPKYHYID